MELHKNKGWKISEVLVATMCLAVVSVVLFSTWGETRPMLQLSFAPETKASSLNWYFGDHKEVTKAIWANKELEEPDRTGNDANIDQKNPLIHQFFRASQSRADAAQSSVTCDFTQGYWIRDESRPLYDGTKCKRFLSGMWACRLLNRPDFEYEELRWQPDGCDLPAFTSRGFLERMKNKVVAFVGDSLGRGQFQSLMCMLTEGVDEEEEEEVLDVGLEWGVAPTNGSLRGKGYAYRFTRTNTTVMFYWTATLSLIEYNRPEIKAGWAALHVDQPDEFLRDDIQRLDLVILNSGHHWNPAKFKANQWQIHVAGHLYNFSSISAAYNFSMYKIVEYLDSKLAESGGKPTVFMRTLSPRHFKNGDWNTGGTCDNTRARVGQKVTATYQGLATEMVIDNAVVSSGSKRVRLLNITPLSITREEGHISKYGWGKDSGFQDCLHWCLPGVPDTWNELLYGYLATDSSLVSST